MALVNKSAIKDVVGELSIATEYYDKLEEEVSALITRSVERAKANQRNTVMRRDL